MFVRGRGAAFGAAAAYPGRNGNGRSIPCVCSTSRGRWNGLLLSLSMSILGRKHSLDITGAGWLKMIIVRQQSQLWANNIWS